MLNYRGENVRYGWEKQEVQTDIDGLIVVDEAELDGDLPF